MNAQDKIQLSARNERYYSPPPPCDDIIFKLAAPHSEMRVRRATERVWRVSLFIIIRGYLKDVIKI